VASRKQEKKKKKKFWWTTNDLGNRRIKAKITSYLAKQPGTEGGTTTNSRLGSFKTLQACFGAAAGETFPMN